MDSAERCLDLSLHRGQMTSPFGESTVAFPVMTTRGGVVVVVVVAREGGVLVVAGARLAIGLVAVVAGAIVAVVAVGAGATAGAVGTVGAVGAGAGILKTSPVCSSTCSSAPISIGARRMSDGMMANDDVVFADVGG